MTEREKEREREPRELDGTSLRLINKINFSKDIKILRERESKTKLEFYLEF